MDSGPRDRRWLFKDSGNKGTVARTASGVRPWVKAWLYTEEMQCLSEVNSRFSKSWVLWRSWASQAQQHTELPDPEAHDSASLSCFLRVWLKSRRPHIEKCSQSQDAQIKIYRKWEKSQTVTYRHNVWKEKWRRGRCCPILPLENHKRVQSCVERGLSYRKPFFYTWLLKVETGSQAAQVDLELTV